MECLFKDAVQVILCLSSLSFMATIYLCFMVGFVNIVELGGFCFNVVVTDVVTNMVTAQVEKLLPVVKWHKYIQLKEHTLVWHTGLP